jgi:hypothetical protein
MVHLGTGSAKPQRQPSQGRHLVIVILSEVRRSVAMEREWKDLLSSAPTRLRQGILTAAHEHHQRSPRTHTNVAHA